MTISTNVGQYLINRLHDLGVRHVFGVPGDYVLGFYGMLAKSPIEVVGTTREDAAAYAADAYARVNGLGAVCVTYCVGGLSICNPIAGAFAEKSPVVVISGAPGIGERVNNPFLHHKVREFTTQREVFEPLTIAAAELGDADTAFREIDRVLNAALRFKRPVYLELPRDRVTHVPSVEHHPSDIHATSDLAALDEAVSETVQRINNARLPMIVAGVEVHRFRLQPLLLNIAEQSSIPIATTLLGKSVISEMHPSFVGIYAAGLGKDNVRRLVEESDCLILLGAFMTDIDHGFATPTLDPAHCIYATSEQLRVGHHYFHDVLFEDFLARLAESDIQARSFEKASTRHSTTENSSGARAAADEIDSAGLFGRLQDYLTDDTVVIADIGDSLFGSMDLCIHQQTEFLSTAYYTTMGFAVPAALGANLARPDLRPLVIVGDGAFQMTGMELSTILKRELAPIVIVLNNGGYGTERLLHEGGFNDIPSWKYHQLPELLGGGRGFEVRTVKELEAALQAAADNRSSFSLVNVHLRQDDHSAALRRLGKRLGMHV